MKNRQLKIGTRIEAEHKGTYAYIKKYVRKYGKMPPQKQVYKHIALNHLKENKSYYSKLKKARL